MCFAATWSSDRWNSLTNRPLTSDPGRPAGFARRTFIPYAETFGDSFVQGRVERVDTDTQTVVLQGGRVRRHRAFPLSSVTELWSLKILTVPFVPLLQEIQYSHLILCTGTDGAFPGKFNTVASYQTAVQKYEDFIQQVGPRDQCWGFCWGPPAPV